MLSEFVSGSVCHSLFVDRNQLVWAAGDNKHGQLGVNRTPECTRAIFVTNVPPIIAVAVNRDDSGRAFHSLLLDSRNRVWATGNNCFGALGSSKLDLSTSFSPVENLPPIRVIVCGGRFSLMLDFNDIVWATGKSEYGPLVTAPSGVPIQIDNLPRIQAVQAGQDFSVFLDFEGNVWTLGDNEYGQLGIGKSDGKGVDSPVMIPDIPPMKSIATCHKHLLMLDNDRNVWAVGSNMYGQLGLKISGYQYNFQTPSRVPDIPKIHLISAGNNHSVLVDEAGMTWVAGRNQYGQIGQNSSVNVPFFTALLNMPRIKQAVCGPLQTWLYDENGILWGLGWNAQGQLGTKKSLGKTKYPRRIRDFTLPEVQAIASGVVKSARKA